MCEEGSTCLVRPEMTQLLVLCLWIMMNRVSTTTQDTASYMVGTHAVRGSTARHVAHRSPSESQCSSSYAPPGRNMLFSMLTVFPALALLFLTTIAILYTVRLLCLQTAKDTCLPPGSKRIPIIEDLHQLPPIDQHIIFMEWAMQYELLGAGPLTLECNRYTAAIVFEISYGRTVTSLDDSFLAVMEDGMRRCLTGSGIMSALVEFFPSYFLVEYAPAWLPGTHWKYSVKVTRKAVAALEDVPFHAVKTDVCSSRGTLKYKDERDIKGAAGTLYIAETDTSLTSMITFVVVMVQHPEILKKAQYEMNRVVGAVPRQAEEDVYRGYYIPKGSTIVTNLWLVQVRNRRYFDILTHIQTRTSSSRLLDMSGDVKFDFKDPKKIVFGSGRRCGYISIQATVPYAECGTKYASGGTSPMATYGLRRQAWDESNEEITSMPKFLSGNVIDEAPFMRSEPFVCEIHPRSEDSLRLILDSDEEL
ncbi:cytochrome P450 [Daedalea quercina L-15889]|uniref:Cytochrome P450 n=1 Tax=Daedalea quercina L-15889 TaxID=1314783 RepID=A0A165QER1_9APHY|nr:cytochrome P450 [Daedalea quercina L-15889]